MAPTTRSRQGPPAPQSNAEPPSRPTRSGRINKKPGTAVFKSQPKIRLVQMNLNNYMLNSSGNRKESADNNTETSVVKEIVPLKRSTRLKSTVDLNKKTSTSSKTKSSVPVIDLTTNKAPTSNCVVASLVKSKASTLLTESRTCKTATEKQIENCFVSLEPIRSDYSNEDSSENRKELIVPLKRSTRLKSTIDLNKKTSTSSKTKSTVSVIDLTTNKAPKSYNEVASFVESGAATLPSVPSVPICSGDSTEDCTETQNTDKIRNCSVRLGKMPSESKNPTSVPNPQSLSTLSVTSLKQPHAVPIYKSTLTNLRPVLNDDPPIFNNESDVYDYFSNSQENADDFDENREVINKLKQQDRIQLVKKKQIGARKKPVKKTAKPAAKPVKNVQEMALKGLKTNLLQALQEKNKMIVKLNQATVSSPNKRPIELTPPNDLDNTLDISIIPRPLPVSSLINETPLAAPKSMSNLKKLPFKPNLCQPSHQSTPIRQITVPLGKNVQLAPKSPWRVTENYIPRTTYYASSSKDNLPTYSSDIIQVAESSSVAQKKASRTAAQPLRQTSLSVNSPFINVSTGSIPENVPNLSNIENIAPELTQSRPKSTDRPVIILGERNINTFRSPLKPLAIRNVLLSPPKHLEQQKSLGHFHSIVNQSPLAYTSSSNDSIEMCLSMMPERSTPMNKVPIESTKTARKPKPSNDCFGFDTSEDSSDENAMNNLPRKNELMKKMRDLKRLLPNPVRETSRAQKIAKHQDLFQSSRPKPNNIKEVFNAVTEQSAAKTKSDFVTIKASKSTLMTDSFDCVRMGMDKEDSNVEHCPDLFQTLWPEKDKASRRSYTRVPKRKHFVESSFTDDEEDEHDTEDKARQKRTKTAKRKAQEAAAAAKELNKFADEFNSMCEMVDEYELVIDKSA